MGRNNIIKDFRCDLCNHTLKGYSEFEDHRSYFHNKDIEKIDLSAYSDGDDYDR